MAGGAARRCETAARDAVGCVRALTFRPGSRPATCAPASSFCMLLLSSGRRGVAELCREECCCSLTVSLFIVRVAAIIYVIIYTECRVYRTKFFDTSDTVMGQTTSRAARPLYRSLHRLSLALIRTLLAAARGCGRHIDARVLGDIERNGAPVELAAPLGRRGKKTVMQH